jgi:hypothetical protein
MTDEIRTKTGRVLSDADFDRLADEAERGYDVSGHEPTLPTIWVAELLTPGGNVIQRVVLTNRDDAERALAASWRIVRYVRADVEASLTLLRSHVQGALERAREALDAAEAKAGAPLWQTTEPLRAAIRELEKS